jgi:hypothetical protein
MEAVCASEVLAEFCRITWHYFPEGGILKPQFCHLFSLPLEKSGLTWKIYARDMTNIYENILSRVGVPWLIIRGSGFIDTSTFTQFETTGNYIAIAILHTFQFIVPHALGFSVFISRILATDLSQSHSNFNSHVTSFSHSLIPFLSFPAAANS